jgi:hypothetical protein
VRPSLLGPALALVALAGGCQERRYPWDQGDAAAPPSPSRARTPLIPSGIGAPADSDGGKDPNADDEEARAPTPPVRVGGPWVRCYGNFHPGGDPVKDVTRLALLCGPANGMHQLTKKPFEGSVAEGSAGVAETFEAKRGECYRVFAAAEPGVADLDVAVRSSRGFSVAADHSEDSWPIVQPDRPFCPLADDRYTVEVSAHRGRGRFAAEVWALRSPKAPGRRSDEPATD